ncbi:MAG: aromatic-ring-hydroxylating dioxygenase subunit beta [Cycloclasticus sp.]|nr:aromatic-ring-hydroxylating dioxygenase subunit beta [Cycloclasticus sp.]
MSSTFDLKKLLESPKIDVALQQNIEQFYYREALLLDNAAYDDWFALLDEDIHYFMPIRRNVMKRGRVRDTDVSEYSGADEFAHFDDDINTMRGRLRKLQSDFSWSENPTSRTRHLVTNVIIHPTDIEGTYEVCSAFLVYRNRLETQVDIFAGERHDVLRRADNDLGFKIAKRTLLLDQSTVLSNNISIFF